MNGQTKGQVEDILTKKAIIFYKALTGVGPTSAKTYIIEDMIMVRLQGPLLPIEKKLLSGKKGVEFVKNIRRNLHHLTVDEISKIIKEVTNQNVISSHSDISTKTGEIVEIFVLDNNYQKQLELQK